MRRALGNARVSVVVIGFVASGLSGCASGTSQGRAADSYTGNWIGSVDNHFGETALILEVAGDGEQDRVTFNLPETGRAWITVDVDPQPESLSFGIPLGGEPDQVALKRDGSVLRGEWHSDRWDAPARVEVVHDPGFAFPEETRFVIDGPAGQLGGSILMPRGEGPFPGVVILHGSGDAPREGGFVTGRHLTERGIMVLTFDKRGVGESEGSWLETDFHGLAADAVAMAEYLADHPLADPAAIGFLGHSQGGWTVPLAAGSWGPAAFAVTRSGPAVPPSREGDWDVIRSMRTLGYPESDLASALAITQAWRHGVKTADWGLYDRLRAKATGEQWYTDVAMDRWPDRPDPAFAAWYAGVMDFDPVPVIERLEAPMLAILGREDESIDALETAEILRGLATVGANVEVIVYEGYDHGIRELQQEPPVWRRHPSDYFDRQAAFILRATGYANDES